MMRTERFCGREFDEEDRLIVQEVVDSCQGLSRMELARTVCELLDWKRPSGSLKTRECRDLLERWHGQGWLRLPDKRKGRVLGSPITVPRTAAGEPDEPLIGTVSQVGPVALERVGDAETNALFRELVGRYHYLGYRVPFGASLRYLVVVPRPRRRLVGAVQFSSPAWRMAVRERWIGWDDETRRRNLQRVINNSRFLLLPWVQVRNLASVALSKAVQRVGQDWLERYAVEPVLAETLVDTARYRGSCYRAANWVDLGQTSGRGRMDRRHALHGAQPKTVLVYPLVRNARRRLLEG